MDSDSPVWRGRFAVPFIISSHGEHHTVCRALSPPFDGRGLYGVDVDGVDRVSARQTFQEIASTGIWLEIDRQTRSALGRHGRVTGNFGLWGFCAISFEQHRILV